MCVPLACIKAMCVCALTGVSRTWTLLIVSLNAFFFLAEMKVVKTGYKDGVRADQKVRGLWTGASENERDMPILSTAAITKNQNPLQHQTRNYHRQDAPPLSNCTPPGSLSDGFDMSCTPRRLRYEY